MIHEFVRLQDFPKILEQDITKEQVSFLLNDANAKIGNISLENMVAIFERELDIPTSQTEGKTLGAILDQFPKESSTYQELLKYLQDTVIKEIVEQVRRHVAQITGLPKG